MIGIDRYRSPALRIALKLLVVLCCCLSVSLAAQTAYTDDGQSGQLVLYIEGASISATAPQDLIQQLGLTSETDTLWFAVGSDTTAGARGRKQHKLVDTYLVAGSYRTLILRLKHLPLATDSGIIDLVPKPASLEVPLNAAVRVEQCTALFISQAAVKTNSSAGTYTADYRLLPPKLPPPNALAFVSNAGSDNVTVIDRFAHRIVDVIRTGRRPEGIAYAPLPHQLLVANHDSHTLSIIDPNSLDIINTVMLNYGDGPQRIVISPELSQVFVLNVDSYSVTVLDARTFQELYRISIGFPPVDLAIDAAVNRLYVTSQISNDIAVFDAISYQYLTTYSVGTSPAEILAVPSESSLIVSDRSRRSVTIFSAASGGVQHTLQSCAQAAGIAYDQLSRRLYVSAPGCSEVDVLQPIDELDLGSISCPEAPGKLTLDPEHRDLWITLPQVSQVQIISTNSRKIVGNLEVGRSPYMICMTE